MIKTKLTTALLAAALSLSAAEPQFDAASVRVNPSPRARPDASFTPGRFTATAVSVKQLVATAFDLKEYQLTLGPNAGSAGAPSDAYDVVATSAGPATEAELRVMLQALLKDRFHLAFHREPKDLPVYALVVAKNGPKLKPSEGKPSTQLSSEGGVALIFKSTPMSAFTQFLTNMAPLEGRPVIDRTGLTAAYDFTLSMSDALGPASPDAAKKAMRNWPSLFADLQEQLGLKLEAQKAPVDMFVVDKIEKPSEN